MPRSVEAGTAAGRRRGGTAHTELSAFCMAIATPRAPSKAPARPTTRARPVLCSGLTLLLICGPITGYALSAELTRCWRSAGSLRTAMSSSVTSTSSSGKIATKA